MEAVDECAQSDELIESLIQAIDDEKILKTSSGAIDLSNRPTIA